MSQYQTGTELSRFVEVQFVCASFAPPWLPWSGVGYLGGAIADDYGTVADVLSPAVPGRVSDTLLQLRQRQCPTTEAAAVHAIAH